MSVALVSSKPGFKSDHNFLFIFWTLVGQKCYINRKYKRIIDKIFDVWTTIKAIISGLIRKHNTDSWTQSSDVLEYRQMFAKASFLKYNLSCKWRPKCKPMKCYKTLTYISVVFSIYSDFVRNTWSILSALKFPEAVIGWSQKIKYN